MYYQLLEKYIKKQKTMLCFGLDPDLEKIPSTINGSTKQRIVNFYCSIIDSAPKNSFAALKPNYAFFAQYGFEGIFALKELIDFYKDKYLIILDAKRGDIQNTSKAYVKEIFEFFRADATTIWPFMGFDSIKPFLDKCKESEVGVYFLARTSNPSAQDFLLKNIENRPLYLYTIEKILEWGEYAPGAIGAVVGATAPQDLKMVLEKIKENKIALLIPGIGTQGGDAYKIKQLLEEYKMQQYSLVNSSSQISWAYLKTGKDYVQAAIEQIKILSDILKIE
jgi:orotidine-5'-phosphate decarboxylase